MTKFCTECGSALSEKEHFCPSCGKKFDAPIQLAEVEADEAAEEVVPSRVVESAPREKLSVWKKVVLSLVLVVIAAGVGGHFVIKSMTEGDKTVLPIYNALLNNDENGLFEKLTVAKDVNYDAKAYMSYIKTQKMDRFLQKLKETASDTQQDGITRVIKHDDGSEILRVKEKKFLYFYPTIEIIPVTTEVVVETDLKQAKLLFHKKETKLNGEPINLGSFLPGNYMVEATSDNPIFPHTAKWPLSVTTAEKSNPISLMKKELMVELDGDHTDSLVYLNGKSTEKTIAELKQIGPIFGDTEVNVYVQKKTPTGEVAKSNEEVVYGGSDSYFTYPNEFSFIVKTAEEIAEETFDRDELSQFVIDFREAYEKSLTSKKYAIIEPYLAPGSTAAKEIIDFIGSIGDDYYEYNFTMNEVLGVKLTVEEASVKTYEEFYFTNHDYETIFYQRDKQYDIRIDEYGDYKVHKIHIFDTKKNQ